MRIVSGVVIAASAGAALASSNVVVPELEIAKHAGEIRANVGTGASQFNAEKAGGLLRYDNLNAPAAPVAAFSSTDLTAVWGDRLGMLGGGELKEFGLSVFNSASSAGALLSATVNVTFYNGATDTLIGGFNTNLTFGAAGLAQGFFTTVTLTGIEALDLILPQDVIVRQTITARTGTATRLGVVLQNPLLAGTTSPDTMFIRASTVGGNAPNFYTITNAGVPIAANVAYSVEVVPAPGAAAMLGLGGLVAARRRR